MSDNITTWYKPVNEIHIEKPQTLFQKLYKNYNSLMFLYIQHDGVCVYN